MYMHNLHHPIVSEAPEISLEYEDIDVIYIPDQYKGSSGSDFDQELMEMMLWISTKICRSINRLLIE